MALSLGIVERTVGGLESVVLKDQLVLFLSRGLPDSSVIDSYIRITVCITPEAREAEGVKVVSIKSMPFHFRFLRRGVHQRRAKRVITMSPTDHPYGSPAINS